ncbi:MAG: polysaccharide biosynthesis tyrosine autokinase, partial [bacterium]|nr:polysaccharide biosynthesis tyrosine autokinase [bacterium]
LQQRINRETVNIAQENLTDAKTQYESALKRKRAMQKLLSGQKKENVKDKTNAIHYKSLSIEVQNMRNLLDFLDRKQRETVMASSNHEGAELSNIKIIDPADVPRRPISPKRRVVLIMALLMGICGGLGLVFLMEFLDRTIKNPEDVKTLLNVPTLGLIPASNTKSLYDYYQQYANTKKKNVAKKEAKDIEMINFLAPSSPLSENYRNVRTSILLSTPQQPPKVIAISSARPEEGKTSTAVNMAIAFQQLGKKVLLIDGDLRKPRVHKIFRLKNTKGLSSFLVGRCKLTEAVWDTDVPNLSVITSGPIPPNPVELLDSDAMLSLLNDNSSKYDFIFIDSPPFVGLADPIILGKISDGLILVTWAGKTNRRFIEKAKAEIDQFGIRMLGVVLNKVNQKSGLGYQYNYQYKEEG